jgi:hypothetical protein
MLELRGSGGLIVISLGRGISDAAVGSEVRSTRRPSRQNGEASGDPKGHQAGPPSTTSGQQRGERRDPLAEHEASQKQPSGCLSARKLHCETSVA